MRYDKALKARTDHPDLSRSAQGRYIRSSRLRGTCVRVHDAVLELGSLFLDYDDWAVRFFGLTPRHATRGGRRPDGDALAGSPLQIASIDSHRRRITLRENCCTLAPLQQGLRGGVFPAGYTAELARQCNLPPFWNGTGTWGDHETPQACDGRTDGTREDKGETGDPPALVEDGTLMDRRVMCPDGRLGDICDLVVDVEHWKARYLIVRLVSDDEEEERLLSPFWISIQADGSTIRVPMTKATVLNAPCFDPDDLTRFDESVLAQYYGFLVES